jgi:hypothetical protein
MARYGFMRHIETAEYLNGYAAALAAFHRWHRQPELVEAVMIGEGISLDLLTEAQAEPEDLVELAKCVAAPTR